jgi:hypothetical protein
VKKKENVDVVEEEKEKIKKKQYQNGLKVKYIPKVTQLLINLADQVMIYHRTSYQCTIL